MSEHNTYLTDEELNQLISDVEVSEMVSAPPDMLEEILTRLDGEFRIPGNIKERISEVNPRDKRAKEKEFRMYCFRVIGSVAAAIMLLFVMPKAGEINLKLSEVMQENTMDGKVQVTPRYATKEDALNNRSLWTEVFGNKLFDGEYRFGNFFD